MINSEINSPVRAEKALSKNILIMAAGTGGHIFPALAVALALREQGNAVFWLATVSGMEHKLVPESGINLYPIDIQGIRGNGLKRLLLAPFKILGATLAAMRIMRNLKIDAVVGFGGYVAGPGGVAARLLGIPLVIHEQNAIAGMTNTYLSKISSQTLQAFPTAFVPSAKVLTTGNPVRQEICDVLPPTVRFVGREGAINVLVIGGSLGAQALNTHVPVALKQLAEKTGLAINVTHQCGQAQLDTAQAAYTANQTILLQSNVVPFIVDMAEAYSDADIVICRAGALTVSEIAAVGVPAVFIPLPSAVDDHQTKNAQYLTRADAAILCPQSSLIAGALASQLERLLNREVLMTMAVNGRKQAITDATARVVTVVGQWANA